MTERIKHFLPAIILLLVAVGLVAWYMMRVPAPSPFSNSPTPSSPEVSEPATITEEAPYYSVEATHPTATSLSATAGAEADARAVSVMKSFVEGEIARFKKEGNFPSLTAEDVEMLGLGERKYELGIEYKTYGSVSTLSYVYQMYVDTGGAHPNTYYRTFTFDKITGVELLLKDLFTANAPYLQTLSTVSRATLPGMIAKMAGVTTTEVDMEYIESGTKPEVASFQSFYFDGNRLVLLFPPYQVGPYVLGMLTLPLSTADLKDLKPEYRK